MTEATLKTNNQENGISVETQIQDFCLEHDGHYLLIENQAIGKKRSCNVKDLVLKPSIEFWNIDMQFGRARKYINNPANLPTTMLNN